MNEQQRRADKVERKQGLNSQSIGLLPVLLLMFLSNFYPYRLSFLIAVFICAGSIILFRGLFKDRVYLFMLLPASATLVLYSVFFYSILESILYNYSPLITEWLLVAVLSVLSSFRRLIIKYVRKSSHPVMKHAQLRTSLTEYFYVAQIVQNLYTLHFFILLFYVIFFEAYRSVKVDYFLYHGAPFIIGMTVILFEQVRLSVMKRRLQREKWLPVLNGRGKVIGRIAYSVTFSSGVKYCHPVVRVAVVHHEMLYLIQRADDSPVSPGMLDYPFLGYVAFKRTMRQTLQELMGMFMPWSLLKPRFLVRYLFENEKVSSLVSFYAITLRTEDKLAKYVKQKNGKWWTKKQIDENLGKGIFSEYFEKEYPYLQNTVLLAEQFNNSIIQTVK
ncbi:MAG: hypothetical protein LBT78_04005 [Tannerella sp.]|jgi:hypothetical protein|nr:hypothetical protein [Tannerella sp.]